MTVVEEAHTNEAGPTSTIQEALWWL